jgi:hypothetical protein
MQGSPYRDCGGAGIHFSETGLNEHAQLWFDVLVVQVPKPSTLLLAAIGVLGVLCITRQRSDEL